MADAFGITDVIVVSLTVTGDIAGTQQFLFSKKFFVPVNLAMNADVKPYLLDWGASPTRIEQDKALTQRSRVTLRFADDDDAPDFDTAVFTTFKDFSFWRRLVVAQPDYIGSGLEIRRGSLVNGVVAGGFAAMRTIFKGRLESINLNDDGTASLVAKDLLALQDRLVPSRLSNTNLLDTAIIATDSTISIVKPDEVTDPDGLDSRDLFPIIIRLQPDSIEVLLATASYTAATRELTQAGSFADYVFRQGDKIFLSHGSITDALFAIQGRLNDNTIIMAEEVDSGNLTNVASIPFEDVIINRRLLAGNMVVQQNQLDESNNFADAAWPKTNVTVDSKVAVGPFGAVRADQLNFPAETDFIEQDSGVASGLTTDHDSAVWLKRRPDATADETITIDQRLSDDSQIQSSQVTMTKDWQRFQVTRNVTGPVPTMQFRITRAAGDAIACLAFGAGMYQGKTVAGFYAAAFGGSNGFAAGRGAFGTTASAHAVNTPISEVLVYRQHETNDGVHPIVIIRDLLNRGGILSADVDQATFDREFDFIQDSQLRKAGRLAISEPARLSEHIGAVRTQALIDLWASETGLVSVRLSFRQNIPGQTIKDLSHENNIIFRALAIDNNAESRITRIFVFFDPLVARPEENGGLFQSVQIAVDLGVEALSGEKSRRIFGDWIFRNAEAVAVAGRILGRFKRAARIIKTRLDLVDEPDFDVGDVVSVNTPDVLKSGAAGIVERFGSKWQVIQKTHLTTDGQLRLEALEFSGRKYAIISPDDDLETGPDPFPDHDDASDAELEYGFIGDSNNEVTPSSGLKIDGYYIL